MARNDLIFRGIAPNMQSVSDNFKREFALVILRAKVSKQHLMSSWVEAAL
jgi:hypothetical protein